jgi:hypothetical protein
MLSDKDAAASNALAQTCCHKHRQRQYISATLAAVRSSLTLPANGNPAKAEKLFPKRTHLHHHTGPVLWYRNTQRNFVQANRPASCRRHNTCVAAE